MFVHKLWISYPLIHSFAKFDRGVYAECAVVFAPSDKRRALHRGANSMPTKENSMNGAPEIERHALARAFHLSAPLRGALLALRRAWGASAPRDRAGGAQRSGQLAPSLADSCSP